MALADDVEDVTRDRIMQMKPKGVSKQSYVLFWRTGFFQLGQERPQWTVLYIFLETITIITISLRTEFVQMPVLMSTWKCWWIAMNLNEVITFSALLRLQFAMYVNLNAVVWCAKYSHWHSVASENSIFFYDTWIGKMNYGLWTGSLSFPYC